MEKLHILIPTDFSAESRRSVVPACTLACGAGGRVTLLHVVPDLKAIPYGAPFAPPQSDPEVAVEMERARQALLDLCVELRDGLPDGVKIAQEVVSAGRVGHEICSWAESHAVDLIAMSSHGHGNLRRLLLGSVTQTVLSEASLPVIVYPKS